MKRRKAPPRLWCVTDGSGRGIYSFHLTRKAAHAACYFLGARVVRYVLT